MGGALGAAKPKASILLKREITEDNKAKIENNKYDESKADKTVKILTDEQKKILFNSEELQSFIRNNYKFIERVRLLIINLLC